MDDGIRICISSRCDMFEKYYTVPDGVAADVQSFVADLEKLGMSSVDAVDFEAKFAANGFQERFNGLIVRCTPKPYNMTREEKAAAKQTAKEIFKEDRSRIIKEAAADALDYAAVMAEEELMAQKRKAMIDAGVYDEYTRASNVLDNVKETGGWFKNHFRKKK